MLGMMDPLKSITDKIEEIKNEVQRRVHHKDGWTAISFWDRSVDERSACNSTYFAEGKFSFEQMVEMASSRFAERWNRMKFLVTQAKECLA